LSARNMHATALLVGDRGVVVLGASGSGKTTFALTLVAQARAAGLFSRIVADDQVFAEAQNGRLLCKVPAARWERRWPRLPGSARGFRADGQPRFMLQCVKIAHLAAILGLSMASASTR